MSLFKKPVSDYKRNIKHLHEELLRKDKKIEELKEQNAILMRTMMRENEKSNQITDHAKELLRINKELKKKIRG